MNCSKNIYFDLVFPQIASGKLSTNKLYLNAAQQGSGLSRKLGYFSFVLCGISFAAILWNHFAKQLAKNAPHSALLKK